MKTIVALATGQINCAIHIIRVSGDDCYNIVNHCLKKQIKRVGYKLTRNTIVDNKKTLDDVLILTFVKPRSFTGEDCIEIQCHGGLFLATTIIKLLIKHGATLATPGEFSKRAYLNNKISLNKAESINNLINAKSKLAADVASHGMDNTIVKKLTNFANNLFTLIGQVEVNIDYPEYDDQPLIKTKKFIERLKSLIKQLNTIINNSKIVQKVMKGFNLVIVGAPNVGKSSLLNAITKQERAIVSPIPGTTRDAVSESLMIDGVAINLIDTAGFHTTTDMLESKGIAKTKESIKRADLIIHLQDATKLETKWNNAINTLICDIPHFVVLNKCDKLKSNQLIRNKICISAKFNRINPLITKLRNYLKKTHTLSCTDVVQSQYSLDILESCVLNLEQSLTLLVKKQPMDFCLEHLHHAHQFLHCLLFNTKEYNFIDKMFATFCLGK